MKKIYLFGNGNTSWAQFQTIYVPAIESLLAEGEAYFMVCDFRGVDTLAMEFLKTQTPHVTVLHVGERARYLPDAFRTEVGQWQIVGGYASDAARDQAAIAQCSHFLAIDYNSDEKRKSGTQKNIERCLALGKLPILAQI
jgi:hypothetical protein